MAEFQELPPALTPSEMSKLIQELRIHQIELEMQNEELSTAQVEVERSRRAYRDLWEHAPIGYLILEGTGRILVVNRAGQTFFKRSRRALLQKRFQTLVAPEDRVAVHLLLEKAIESASALKCEIKILTPDGTPLYGQLEGKALDSVSGQARIQLVIMDTTDRKQAEDLLCQSRNELDFRVQQRTAELDARSQDLKKLNAQMRAEIARCKAIEQDLTRSNTQLAAEHAQRQFLSKKLVDMLERERREVALTLHEEIAQRLAALKMDLELPERHRTSGLTDCQRAAQCKVLEIIDHIRRVSRTLRPSSLDMLGLIPALRELIQNIQDNTDLRIHCFFKIPKPIDAENQLTLFRIAQEALANIVKHAHAAEVFISLTQPGAYTELSVEDDGIGFDYEQTLTDQSEARPLGIAIIRERALHSGGSCTLESRPGRGTHVMVEIPRR